MFSRLFTFRNGAAAAALAFGTTSAFTVQQVYMQEKLPGATLKQFREEVVGILEERPQAGPEFVRLAWHASGTYNRKTQDGGNHGSMDLKPESDDPANAGLHIARKHLAESVRKHPEMSKADIWVLASLIAIEEMGGPKIPFYYGRTDANRCPPTGRLPDATKGQDHIRDVFTGRLGFNDRETVALIGAHALGRCYPDRSGFDGPWTFDPYGFSNSFFTELLGKEWVPRTLPSGVQQYQDKETRSLMMLPSDIALLKDPAFLRHVKAFADDNDVFCDEFSKAYTKLVNLSWEGKLAGPVTDY